MVLRTNSNLRNMCSRHPMKTQSKRQESMASEPRLPLLCPVPALWEKLHSGLLLPGTQGALTLLLPVRRLSSWEEQDFRASYLIPAPVAEAGYWEKAVEKWGLPSSAWQRAMGTYEPESMSKDCGTVPIILNNVSNCSFISLIFTLSSSHSSRNPSGNSRRLSNLKEQKSRELIKLGTILERPRKVTKALILKVFVSLLFQQ